MNRKKPKVSWVVPFRDPDPQWLVLALESIIRQTDGDWELLAANDGTRDELLRRQLYELHGADPRIRLVGSPDHRGLARTLNAAIAQARGEYVARLDADDMCVDHRQEVQVGLMDDDPDLAVLGSYCGLMYSNGTVMGSVVAGVCSDRDEGRMMLEMGSCPFAHPSVMFRKSAWEEAGGYPEDYPHAEDYALWCRMTKIDPKWRWGNIKSPYTFLRRHSASVSSVHRSEQRASVVRASREILGRD